MLVSGTFRIIADIYERLVGDLGVAAARHTFDYSKVIESGTGADQADLVWSDKRTTVGGTPDDLDLRGVLRGPISTTAAFEFVRVTGIIIRNKSTTPGQFLTIGNDAAACFAGLFNAVPDRIKVQPGGCFAWFAPMAADNLTTTAVTADILQVDGGANAVEYEIVVIGRTV